jgi:hypothetical protein
MGQWEFIPFRAEYGTFLEAWKYADSDLPLLIRAKQEFARL